MLSPTFLCHRSKCIYVIYSINVFSNQLLQILFLVSSPPPQALFETLLEHLKFP